jgi:hypothetical protein
MATMLMGRGDRNSPQGTPPPEGLRLLLPTFGTDGLRDDADLDDSAALLELMDEPERMSLADARSAPCRPALANECDDFDD